MRRVLDWLTSAEAEQVAAVAPSRRADAATRPGRDRDRDRDREATKHAEAVGWADSTQPASST
jgi:hypothetical protein